MSGGYTEVSKWRRHLCAGIRLCVYVGINVEECEDSAMLSSGDIQVGLIMKVIPLAHLWHNGR